MNYKEKLELKLELLQEIYDCFSLNWETGKGSISMQKMSNLLTSYKYQLKGINRNEISN